MLKDNVYRDTALANRGIVGEEIVYNLLCRVFDQQDVFSALEVLVKKGETVTDLDVSVIHDDVMLIFQVKSKRLTQLSKEGDINQFHKDFGKAVLEANKQAIKPIDSILKGECRVHTRNKENEIDISKIREIYTICVVLDPYPALAVHTRMFFDFEELKPVAVSVFDLDLITRYIKSPEVLIKYFKERNLFSKFYYADNEQSFLGFFLRHNGFPPQEEMTLAYIDNDYAQYFDKDYYTMLVDKHFEIFFESVKSIGRNDPCYCGSGRKHKKCCWSR